MATTAADLVFLDSNILIYASNPTAPEHPKTLEALARLQNDGSLFCASAQVLREYLAVETNLLRIKGAGPRQFRQVLENYNLFLATLSVLPETLNSSQMLAALLADHPRTGRFIHDLNLVAVMITHGVRKILTNNRQDFQDLEPKIKVLPL